MKRRRSNPKPKAAPAGAVTELDESDLESLPGAAPPLDDESDLESLPGAAPPLDAPLDGAPRVDPSAAPAAPAPAAPLAGAPPTPDSLAPATSAPAPSPGAPAAPPAREPSKPSASRAARPAGTSRSVLEPTELAGEFPCLALMARAVEESPDPGDGAAVIARFEAAMRRLGRGDPPARDACWALLNAAAALVRPRWSADGLSTQRACLRGPEFWTCRVEQRWLGGENCRQATPASGSALDAPSLSLFLFASGTRPKAKRTETRFKGVCPQLLWWSGCGATRASR